MAFCRSVPELASKGWLGWEGGWSRTTLFRDTEQQDQCSLTLDGTPTVKNSSAGPSPSLLSQELSLNLPALTVSVTSGTQAKALGAVEPYLAADRRARETKM